MLGGGIFGLAMLALLVYCVFDIISTDESEIQNLPKMFWLLIVIFIPAIGGIAWLLLGRPSNAAWRPGTNASRPVPPPMPPPAIPDRTISSEDHNARREEALRKYHAEREETLRKREEELRRREEELRRRERGD